MCARAIKTRKWLKKQLFIFITIIICFYFNIFNKLFTLATLHIIWSGHKTGINMKQANNAACARKNVDCRLLVYVGSMAISNTRAMPTYTQTETK